MNTSNQSTSRHGNWREQLRPAWTPINIAIMVISFMTGIFWWVGVFMIAYMIWGRDWGLDLSSWGKVEESVNRMGDNLKSAFDGESFSDRSPKTGNAAFDEWREAEMKRLQEERRKLEEAKREFEKYLAELRKARDKEEFERFQSEWRNRNTDTGTDNTGPSY